MSYYEDKVIRVCDANKRFELYDTEPISGYIALSKIRLVFNFYNIKAPQEVLFYEGGEILVETETPLDEYRTKKQKLINDLSAAVVLYKAKRKELLEAEDKLQQSDINEMKQPGYMYYKEHPLTKFYVLDINKYSEMGDRVHNHYLLLKETRKKKHELVDLMNELSKYMGYYKSFSKRGGVYFFITNKEIEYLRGKPPKNHRKFKILILTE